MLRGGILPALAVGAVIYALRRRPGPDGRAPSAQSG